MKELHLTAVALIGCAGIVLLWSDGQQLADAPRTGAQAQSEPRPAEPIEPIPLHLPLDPDKVALGEKLFHAPELSRDGTISCAHCHVLNLGGVDRLARSVGIGGAFSDFNAPTVLNSSFNFKQFWDGRADSLEDQIDGPIHNPKEMASSWPDIIAKLSDSAEYADSFSKIYPDGLTSQNIKDAIASYERSLYTPNAPFDRYLRGDSDVLSEAEKRGYELFKSFGCIACHQGVAVGGNMFQRLGIMGDYFGDRGDVVASDYGRFNVTGEEHDRHLFKVPSLRNVELTPPYFHDGWAPDLEAAITLMAKYQLGRQLADDETKLMVQFLKTLTGDLPIRRSR